MTLSNCASKKTYKIAHTVNSSIKKALLSLAVLGLTIPTIGTSQASANPIASRSTLSRSVDWTDKQAVKQEAAYNKDLAILENGVYLFGQSSQPGQIGISYAIFSVTDNQTVGAFYQPSSSFDCFSGQVLSDRMAFNVVDSYQQTVHPYSIALTTDSSLTAGSAAPGYTLEGFHRIGEISNQDLDILAVCQADLE